MTEERMTPALEICPQTGNSKGYDEWPDPTPEMLDTILFDTIWRVIKTWDVNVPHAYSGYMGATGNHARAIYDAVVPLLENQRASPTPEPVAAMEPVAYRYVHYDYAGRKVSRFGAYPAQVNGHDPIEVQPLYAHPPADPLMDEARDALLAMQITYCDAECNGDAGLHDTACQRASAILAKLGERK